MKGMHMKKHNKFASFSVWQKLNQKFIYANIFKKLGLVCLFTLKFLKHLFP